MPTPNPVMILYMPHPITAHHSTITALAQRSSQFVSTTILSFSHVLLHPHTYLPSA